MWSGQPETGKNMTSLKNKITHRKRKNTKAKADNSTPKPTINRQNSIGNKKGVVKKDEVQPDLIEDIRKGCTNMEADTSIEKCTELNNVGMKRYSDSFMINGAKTGLENKCNSESTHNLLELDGKDLKLERKSRRFSDIFRYGALRPSSSCENLKSSLKMSKPFENCQIDESDFTDVVLRQKNIDPVFKEPAVPKKDKKCGKTNTKVDTKKVSKKETNVENDSYLKRVKSKIYKNKNDNTILPSMPNIAEDTKCKKSKKNKTKETEPSEPLRKAVSQFDFRLIRQTSNLERIRPRTFGLKNSVSNLTIIDAVDSQSPTPVPLLAKSKSSSAINLNLLRTRRNKLLEQAKKNCTIVHNEFDFIAFGGVNKPCVQEERKQSVEDIPDVKCDPEGDGKTGHPVSRSGSDRRPDAVREEASASSTSRVHEGHDHPDNERPDNHHQDSTVSLPAYPGNKKRTSTNINRSESVKEQSEKRKQRRNISDPLRSDANDAVELEQQGLTYHTNSGSSSNSSLSSNRSSESPSTSLDAVTGYSSSHPVGSAWDSDFEVEAEPPAWQSSVPEEELARLHPYEKKRQDVVNELFHTERSHVRNLKVLEHIFKQRLEKSRILKSEEILLIFPNLSELLEIHTTFNSTMKSKRKEGPIVRELGDLIVNMFDGAMGENFQAAAAAFCERQQLALEFIKERRKKDSRFDNSLCECEKDNRCRRLPLQGILPTEMQRLSKYPLLLERLIDSIEKAQEKDSEAESELIKLKLAHDRSKEILNHVNEAAKIACNKARLEDIQRHLDVSAFERTDHAIVNEFKNLDLTRYKLIYEGPMHLRRPNKQPVPVHIVLLEEAVILLQRDAERYVLKFFQAGGTPNPQPLAPIIKTSTLLVRANAASKSSLFLVNTSTQNSQMYDLKTRDASERDTWFKHISDAAEAYNRREGKAKRNEPSPYAEEAETVQELPPPVKGATAERSEHTEVATPNGISPSGKTSRNSDILEEEDKRSSSQSDGEGTQTNEGGGSGLLMKLTADDWPLVQPTEVNIAAAPVHIAEPVLTPIEQIRRKDEEVRKALADKEGLVADLLSIPREDYHLIADMASEETKNCLERDPAELVLAAVYQADQLLAAVNDSLNISEADAVIATGGKHPACASNELTKQSNHVPSVPVSRLKEIATTLSTQLTTLLSVIKQRDEERDRLRKELQRTREQLHDKLSLHPPVVDQVMETTQSADLESIEECTEHEAN